MMKIATVDLTGCKYVYDLHLRFHKAMGFDDDCGKNLDAFWDYLSCDSNVNFISIIGSNFVSDELKPTVKEMIQILEENKQRWANAKHPFDYEVLS